MRTIKIFKLTMSNRILSDHFEKTLDKLKAYFEHSGIAKHGDIKGAAREGFVQLFLEDTMPSVLEYATGEIIDKNDTRSGQVDIILQSSTSPKIKLFGNINISFNDYVLGAIEVKSNLNKTHLINSLELFRKIKSLERDVLVNGYSGWDDKKNIIYFKKTPCFLVAFKGPKRDTLLKQLEEYRKLNRLEIEEFCPQVIVVINREYDFVRNDGWLQDPNNHPGKHFFSSQGKLVLVFLYQYIFQLIDAWNKGFRAGIMPTGDFFKPK